MQSQLICHCGKCVVKCNKHNKRAKCSDCKKVRMLGTVIEKGEIRHICDACCIQHEKEIEEQQNVHIWKELRKTYNSEGEEEIEVESIKTKG